MNKEQSIFQRVIKQRRKSEARKRHILSIRFRPRSRGKVAKLPVQLEEIELEWNGKPVMVYKAPGQILNPKKIWKRLSKKHATNP